jgi:hypothetical protein
VALQEVQDRIANIGRYAREATLQLAMLIIGLVVALSLFINAKWEMEDDPDAVKDSLLCHGHGPARDASSDVLRQLRPGDRRANRHLHHSTRR